MVQNSALLFAIAMPIMVAGSWLGYRVCLHTHTTKRKQFEQSWPGETYPHEFDGISAAGFGCFGGILFFFLLRLFGA
jgi:hypothetical protein